MIHERLIRVVTERIPSRFGLDPVRDIQVLTPMNRGGLGSRALNVELQRQLNPTAQPRIERFGWTYAPGDKVIQLVNDYDKEVFNGDIGHIAAIDLEESLLSIDFDGRRVAYDFGELDEIALAYATTVHKAQGSEYPAVVIPLAIPALHPAAAQPALHRRHPRQAPGRADRPAKGPGHGHQADWRQPPHPPPTTPDSDVLR